MATDAEDMAGNREHACLPETDSPFTARIPHMFCERCVGPNVLTRTHAQRYGHATASTRLVVRAS
jgi:hypothetical protein